MSVERYEVVPSLALHLDPHVLLANGATFTGGGIGRARDAHYFIVVGVSGRAVDLVATSSKPGRGRVRVARKWGEIRWVFEDTFADLFQVWTADIDVVRLAARMSDRSQRGARNFADIRVLGEAA
jgi:hypothetical protein